MLRNIFWKVGILGDYKLEFWKFALRRLARGEIEHLISSILVAHHLIMFARAASGGQQNASNYSMRLREASVRPSSQAMKDAGAVLPLAEGSAGPDPGARRAWPGRRQHADRRAARFYTGPRACPRRGSCRFRSCPPSPSGPSRSRSGRR
jgi:hypothetical protein